MANSVILTVDVQSGQLLSLEQRVARLQTQPINIKVNITGNALSMSEKQINALARLASAQVKQDNANAKLTVSSNNLAISQNKLAIEQERTAQSTNRVALEQERQATAGARAAAKNEQYSASLRKTGQQAEFAKTGVAGFFSALKLSLPYYAAYAAMSKIVSAFSDAFEMMKKVDDELVVIRKVTGMSGDELEKIQSTAYEKASQYGTSADSYLESVAQFSRAGYKAQAEALAELATKTMIVGDTTAEVANQFLLSVDAGYKYKGSIEALSAVLDGANELDNKYATSIEKIAEGMGIVAPVAAQANVGIDELAAAIGTITAVTQRSGSETARALRALFLNIIGDTKTEIDEGVTWTTGEIAGLRDVINTYAPEAVKAAEATGSIIDPMEAVAGLSKAMKDGLLTERELMETVSDIGGKLRTPQLLALIQNWDMYQSMLKDYGNAIGSADREVANALDSWSRKTEILKNKWTDFLQNFINSGTVKVALDIIIGLVEVLDTDFGHFIITAGLLVAAGSLLTKGITALGTSIKIAAVNLELARRGTVTWTAEEIAAAASTVTLGEAVKALTVAMLSNPLFWGAAAVGLIAGIVAIVDACTTSLEEQREKVAKLNAEYEQMFGVGSEYDTLIKKEEELTAKEKARLEILKGIRAEKEATTKIELDKEFELFQERVNSTNVRSSKEMIKVASRGPVAGGKRLSDTEQAVYDLSKALKDNSEAYYNAEISATKYKNAISSAAEKHADFYNDLIKYRDAGFELTELQNQFIAEYEATALADMQERLSHLWAKEKTAWNSTTDVIKDYIRIMAALADQNDNNRGRTSVGWAHKAWQEQHSYKAWQEQHSYWLDLLGDLEEAEKAEEEAAEAEKAEEEAAEAEKKTSGTGGSGTDQKRKALEAIVNLRKSELKYLQESGASESEQIAKLREVQDALHNEAEYLRTTPEYLAKSAEALKDVVDLSAEWWSVDKQIADINQKIIDKQNEQIKQQLEYAKQARDDRVSALEKELDALDAELSGLKKKNEEEKKQNELIEKRIALENALNERNVRVFNAQTGRFEWVANQQTVEKARKDYSNALTEIEISASEERINARIADVKLQIEEVKRQYDRLEKLINSADNEQNHAAASTEIKNYMSGSSYTGSYNADGTKTVKVNPDGNAPKGLLVGDKVITGGGTYEITGFKPGGGYESRLLSEAQSNPTQISTTQNKIGTQNNGNIYNVSGIKLSEAQAKSTTLYELAQRAEGLGIYNNN
ncbi:unnamed protein product [Cylicocyclus nassatus]|uniref:Phage tail tape measure protein domain-containing protein n=1 Tax=Cylicocyclus nassatus TaxID=53992 RepID=A0AA36M463_CYLNA|nr:unnamed protein product [Cylicocyclus nassatus]